nr:hypothetical protein [Legionella qingyii]
MFSHTVFNKRFRAANEAQAIWGVMVQLDKPIKGLSIPGGS